MAVTARLDGAAYEQLVATEPAFERTELFDGIPAEKSAMSWHHGDLGVELTVVLRLQVDPLAYRVRANHARLALPGGDNYYIPDIAVIPNNPPASLRALDLHREPVPLVVEIWSPTTSAYDAAVELPGYRLRGDAEVWWLYPPDRTLTRWLRRSDGGYDEEVIRGGVVDVVALPGVRVDLDALFRH
jgi:Uma2 family endonuclease